MLRLFCLGLFSFSHIFSHFVVGDGESAVKEAQYLHQQNDDDPEALVALIRALALNGEESKMMQSWEQLNASSPEKAHEANLLEEMCWGILKKGKASPSAHLQLMTLIGAALTLDAHALPFLLGGLHSSNSLIRSIAVQLSTYYQDYPLKAEIAHLFQVEKQWEVRQELVRAIGKLKMEELLPDMLTMLSSKWKGSLEKKELIKAIAAIRDSITDSELVDLSQNPRAELRILACECIVNYELSKSAFLLMRMVEDNNSEVVIKALEALGYMRYKPPQNILHANDPKISITGAWALLLSGDPNAEEVLLRYLEHEKTEVRNYAAAAIACAGPYGLNLSIKGLESSADDYVKLNLALNLIGQRKEVMKAAEIIATFLETHPERIMKNEGYFPVIEKSILLHNSAIPNFPEVVNQTTRLKLLNLLAIVEYPHALETIKRFLKENKWNVTGLAAETLLGEGDETSIELIRELLADPDREVQCEAALALAIWGKDNSALPTLIQAYSQGDRQLKIKILEALGRIGDKKAIPFVIEQLKEPSQTLRIISASVLIQILHR